MNIKKVMLGKLLHPVSASRNCVSLKLLGWSTKFLIWLYLEIDSLQKLQGTQKDLEVRLWPNRTDVLIKMGSGTRDVATPHEHTSQEERPQDKPSLLPLWPWTSGLKNCGKINICQVLQPLALLWKPVVTNSAATRGWLEPWAWFSTLCRSGLGTPSTI